MYKLTCFLSGVALFINATPVFSLEDEQSLARASLSFLKKNHFSQHVSLPLENDINFRYQSPNRNQNVLSFKPVIPLKFTSNYDLIIRTIAPIYEATPLPNQERTIRGTGDLNPTLFITPKYFDKWILGLGPTVFMPTTSNSHYIASNKWNAGPEFAAMAILEHWMYGVLTYNVFATAPDGGHIKSSQFSFQYLLAYTFDNGWYVSTNPDIVANWQNDKNQKWLVPFGLGGGKAFYLGKQALNVSSHAYYNVVSPEHIGPAWQLQLEVELLFPHLI